MTTAQTDLERLRRRYLLRRLRASQVSNADPSAAAIPVVDRSAASCLSPGQERLWFLAQLPGASEAYHINAGMHLRGQLDELALRRALDHLVERHESLRTNFVTQQGTVVQLIGA